MTQSIEETLHINPTSLHAYSSALLQGTAYSRLHTNLTRVLQEFSLTIPEWKLLGQVFENDKVKLSTLAELLSYDPPMVTKLIKLLEKKQLLQRTQDPIDERAKIITISSEGKKIILAAEPKVKAAMRHILAGITPEELRIYLKVLTVIVNNTQK